MPLRFHWRLNVGPQPGVPDLPSQIEFCRRAEAGGLEAVLVNCGFDQPDPLLLSAVLGQAATRIVFLVAARSGIWAPTAFVQQVNTLATITGGRVALNIVAGHSPMEQGYYGDFLDHDARYARTAEFLRVCRAFWRGDGPVDWSGPHYAVRGGRLATPFLSPRGAAPEIYVGGASAQAQALALELGDCWLRMPDAPEVLAPLAAPLVRAGRSVGLRCCVILGDTHEAALAAAQAVIAPQKTERVDDRFARNTDSVMTRTSFALASGPSPWITRYLWAGAVPSTGPAGLALVGTPDEVADAILEYVGVGVSQFIFASWRSFETMVRFCDEVLPRVRAREAALARDVALAREAAPAP